MEAMSSTEDSCGKDGRANLPQVLHLCEDTDWPELESMYRLNDNVCDFRENYTINLEDWINFEAELDRMFALVSELNTCSEMMGNAVRNTGLWNPLLYLLFALDYTSPASQGVLLWDDTTNTDPGTDSKGITATSPRGFPPQCAVCTGIADVHLSHPSVQLYQQLSWETSKPSTTLKQHLENVNTFASNWRWWKRTWKRIRNWSGQHWTFSIP